MSDPNNQDDLSLVKEYSLEATSIYSDFAAVAGLVIQEQGLNQQQAAEEIVRNLALAAARNRGQTTFLGRPIKENKSNVL
ncbi:MAG: hypothetical protein MJD61_03395 [Proteobacteria bacterium]|nr:hypothetical protein [Pseudomonadota bacterium]